METNTSILQHSTTPTPLADLHVHTRYSDGTYTAAELVGGACARGLAAVGVTDHDTMDGVGECLEAAKLAGLEIIPGVEITCQVDNIELHLLGYFFSDAWNALALRSVLDHAKGVRDQRTDALIARLNALGIDLTRQDVEGCSSAGTLGRPHVAMALVRRKIVQNVDEAFERFLRRGRPAYVERYRMSVAEAIGHVKRAGGVAVLAHPGLNHVDKRLPDMKAQGLGGLEVWHSRHSPAQSVHYLALAGKLGLLATGGSDCHGTARGEPIIGTVTVPYARVEALRAAAAAL